LVKFAFEFSTEFRALVAKSALRENFALDVLNENIRLVSAVRSALFQPAILAGT